MDLNTLEPFFGKFFEVFVLFLFRIPYRRLLF